MIILDNPADLPRRVRQYREDRDVSRGQVAIKISSAQLRSVASVEHQMHGWEVAGKSPTLASLGAYLRAHGLRLALVPEPREHEWQEFNEYDNSCHFPGCSLEFDEHR